MKNFIFLILASTLIFTSCDFDFGEVNDCNQACDELMATDDVNGTFFSSHGDCVSLCATCSNPSNSAGNQAVCICNYYETYLDAAGLDWDDLGVKNKGQCIKTVKNGISDNEIILIGD